MYLFFDCDVAGKPKDWKAEADNVFNWPRLVKFAYLMYNEKGELTIDESITIKPNGFEIENEDEQKAAMENGVPVKEVLQKFAEAIDQAKYVIVHNYALDGKVVGAEFHRANMPNKVALSDWYSLMVESTHYCKLPGKFGRYKWPSQAELFRVIFKSKYENAGNAKEDVKATALCFFKLLQANALELD